MKDKIQVEIVNKSNNKLPAYETIGSAGMDVRSYIDKSKFSKLICENGIRIPSNTRILIHTGLYVDIPIGYEIQVRPRSGLALKKGIGVLNSPGTIDSDYRGEIGVILINNSLGDFYVKDGDRIAQLVLKESPQLEWLPVTILSNSDRGEGGFGSTGNK